MFTPAEARAVLSQLHGPAALMARLLYGCGLRVNDAVRLRVKDIDFGDLQITLRDAKGGRDRSPCSEYRSSSPLRRQIERRRLEMRRTSRPAQGGCSCLRR